MKGGSSEQVSMRLHDMLVTLQSHPSLLLKFAPATSNVDDERQTNNHTQLKVTTVWRHEEEETVSLWDLAVIFWCVVFVG